MGEEAWGGAQGAGPVGQEHGQGGLGDAPVGGRRREGLPLHPLVQGQQRREAGGQGSDPHPFAHPAPEPEQVLLLQGGQGPPAVAGQPADRLGHEGGEHVEEIVVADRVVAVDAVHALDHRGPGRAVQPMPHQFRHHQPCVVVALAGPALEFPGAGQQAGDGGHAEGLVPTPYFGSRKAGSMEPK